jgi:hypothetical protein
MIVTGKNGYLLKTSALAMRCRQGAIVLALLSLLGLLPASECQAQEQPTVEWTLALRDMESRLRSSNPNEAEQARLQVDINRLRRRIEVWLAA